MPAVKKKKVAFVEAVHASGSWSAQQGIIIPVEADADRLVDAIRWVEEQQISCQRIYFSPKEKAWVAIVPVELAQPS
ncbi:hypothetical protein HM1_0059 [Heliomicrobium modesticaldum Ice1]|uniref:Uncharacterized protein n=1 Tax=Heliobacterium modesticaldum (strain ATCC 51547 / Ice1) TaxID=498761 RepID=B0TI11_HELMI|nr:hypothetical protein [Heliomicrobium modesticaldum]ABZ82684.1 hypothetical protein HM1_0059 [Heliomicrobium modesticaldum Ice1]